MINENNEAPDGAAVFPLIPEELGIHPLLLGVLHAYVFFEGSDDEIVNGAAAEESMEYIATYLQRLRGNELRKIKEDMMALVDFAKGEKWDHEQIEFLNSFLADNGVE